MLTTTTTTSSLALVCLQAHFAFIFAGSKALSVASTSELGADIKLNIAAFLLARERAAVQVLLTLLRYQAAQIENNLAASLASFRGFLACREASEEIFVAYFGLKVAKFANIVAVAFTSYPNGACKRE